ncbi:Na+/H+ antiporter [Gemmatimonas sp.]|uniref:Na+/H+ antiporter n=1 Tax=Gemmatimonas sp. TaxID=1962908 RepID=UPI003F73108D
MESHSPILVGLAFATIVVALTAFGRRLPVPAPVLQVIAGLLVATIPGVAMPTLEPDLVFFVFLPPILWAAAFFTSLREFTANRRPIGLLAIGLVIATTVGVAFVARALFPGMPWAVAVALGAIVSPPDAVAAAAVVSRLPVPRRVIVILEGESLVNDASALVLYRSAVAAAVTGVFSLGESIVRFFLDAGVGILLGLAIGWVLVWALKRTKDELAEILLTLAGPYAAWILAEQIHVSAVLACVAGGLYLRQHYSVVVGPRSRVQSKAVWDLLVFVLNAMIFVLLGMQFTAMIKATTLAQLPALLAPGLIISLVCVVVRLVWVPVATWAPRLLSKEIARVEAVPRPKAVALVAWTSMRGIVSLATAFALPLTLADGSPFPYRQDLLYITMSVILFTLVVQGCTLAPIIRYFKFAAETHHQQEERFARIEALRRAADALEDAAREGWANDDDVSWLRAELQDRLESHRDPARASTRHALRARMRQAERRMLIRLRNEGAISDEVLRELEHELDLDAMRGDSVLAHPH